MKIGKTPSLTRGKPIRYFKSCPFAGFARDAYREDNRLEFDVETNAMSEFGKATDLYFGGDMEASIALTGQVCGRIDAVRPVAEIIAGYAKNSSR